MSAALKFKASPAAISWTLLSLTLLWYWSFVVLFRSGGNFLSHVPWPWLLVCAILPVINAALSIALHLALRASGRGIRLPEILVVVVVAPHFLAAAYVWWGLLYYMGVI
jgi:hypothetical protein